LTFGDQRGLRTPPADFAQEVRRSGIEEASAEKGLLILESHVAKYRP